MKATLTRVFNLDAIPKFPSNLPKEVKELNDLKETDEIKDGDGWVVRVDWRACVVTKERTSNSRGFDLARKIFTVEKKLGRKCTSKSFQAIYDLWHEASKGFLTAGKPYFDEIYSKISLVRSAEGEHLSTAFQKTEGVTPPVKIKEYPTAGVQRLASLCRELASRSPGKPIELSQNAMAKLFNCSRPTIGGWIRILIREDILISAEKCVRGKKATTYSYKE